MIINLGANTTSTAGKLAVFRRIAASFAAAYDWDVKPGSLLSTLATNRKMVHEFARWLRNTHNVMIRFINITSEYDPPLIAVEITEDENFTKLLLQLE